MALNRQLLISKYGLSKPKADKLTERYLDVIAFEVLSRCTYFGQEYENTHFASIDRMRKSMGDFNINKKRYYTFNELNSVYKQVTTIKTGKNIMGITGNGQLSEVTIGEEVLVAIADIAPERVFALMYPEIANGTANMAEYDLIKIDQDSLQEYITHRTQALLRPNLSHNYATQVQDDLVKAKAMLLCSFHFPSHLPHKIAYSQFGPTARKYYSGLNLQSVSKMLRVAALGRCYEVDFNTSAFSIMLDLAYNILKTEDNATEANLDEISRVRFSYTREYIREKASIRKQLARETFFYNGSWICGNEARAIEAIKRAMAAIGFGAKMTIANWTDKEGVRKFPAIHMIISNKEAADRFKATEFIQALMEEQRCVGKYILDSQYAQQYNGIFETMKTLNGKSPSPAQKLSCIYQTEERRLLNVAIEECKKQGKKVLLEVHDALYLQDKVMKNDLSAVLQMEGSRFLTIDGEHVGHTLKEDWTAEQDEQEHKAFIDTQEATATGYKPKAVTVDKFKVEPTDDDYVVVDDTDIDYDKFEYQQSVDAYPQMNSRAWEAMYGELSKGVEYVDAK